MDITVSSFHSVLYLFLSTNTKRLKPSPSSTSVSDFFKPRRTWGSLFFSWFDAGSISWISMRCLFTLCLLCQVFFWHSGQVNSLRFGDIELFWFWQGDPIALQLILTVNVPNKRSSTLDSFLKEFSPLDSCVVFLCLPHPLEPHLIRRSSKWNKMGKRSTCLYHHCTICTIIEINLSVPLGGLCHSHAVVDQQLGKSWWLPQKVFFLLPRRLSWYLGLLSVNE